MKEKFSQAIIALLMVVYAANVIFWLYALTKVLGGIWQLFVYFMANVLIIMILTYILDCCTRPD